MISERAMEEAEATVRKLIDLRVVSDQNGTLSFNGVAVHPKEEVDFVATSAIYGGVVKDSEEAVSPKGIRETLEILREKTAQSLNL